MSQFDHANAGIRPVWDEAVNTRANFLRNTYFHLFGAILLFVAIEVILFQSGVVANVAPLLSNSWLLVLGGFVVVNWAASHVAHTARSLGAQYAALVGMVAAEALIFMPLLYIANIAAPGVTQSAAVVTIGGFAALTGIVFFTRHDFSFLRGIMVWGGLCAMIAIVASLIFGFQLGTWFSVAMIAFAGGAILYDTSNVLHHYPQDRYVGASLQLFTAVALLFWYVLRLFMSRD